MNQITLILYQKIHYISSGFFDIKIKNKSYFFCVLLTITNNGLAKKIDEYVPKNIPAVSIIAKTFVLVGPKKTRARSVIITVEDVAIERV